MPMKNTPILLLLWQALQFCLCLSATTTLCAATTVPSYYFTNLSLKEGLSQLSVMKVYQDQKGYMWFGTRNGLNKYDGSRMTVYKHSAGDSLSLVDNHITALAEDAKHHLWIGTPHGLHCLDLQTDRLTRYAGKRFPMLEAGVRSLFTDSNGRLWVGTSRGLYLFVYEADTFQPVDLQGRMGGEYITSLAETHDHRLLIGTDRKGLFACDLQLKSVCHYTHSGSHPLLPHDNVVDIFEDSRRQLWVATIGGLCRLDLVADTARHYNTTNSDLSTDNIRCLAEAEGCLWVGTFDGLYAIDLADNRLKGCYHAAHGKGTLSHFSIYSLCADRSHNLWVGTYSGGVNLLNRYNNRFVLHEPTDALNQLMGVYGAATCPQPHSLYIATEGGGLLDYDLTSGSYHYYLYDTSSPQHFSRNIVKSLLTEGDYLLCGTTQGSIYRFHLPTRRFSPYLSLPLQQSTAIYDMLRMADGSLWMATSKPEVGLVRISQEGEIQTHFALADSTEGWAPGSSRCLLGLEEEILIGTRHNGLYRYDPKHRRCTSYRQGADGGEHLPADYVTALLRTRRGEIWVGTFGGGLSLFHPQRGMTKHITCREGLQSDEVCMVVEDRVGNLWMSTTGCISRYCPDTDEVTNFQLDSSLGAQEFTPHSGALLPNGDICFSTNNGFLTFSPERLEKNAYLPPLVLISLTVNNHPVCPADGEGSILPRVLDDMRQIELDYDQNNISIRYSALNYVSADLNQYAYRLKGYDREWNYVGNRQEAYYTNLQPGKYLFELKASNNDGLWGNKVRKLAIVVRPPIWATWYARLAYVAAFLGVCFLVMYYILKKKSLEQALNYEQLKQQQAEEFHQTKMRMFTNFSHELRTPLMLMIAPLQELLQEEQFVTATRNKLNLIYHNSQRLLLLVNQLMDLRKNQSGKMQLRIACEDICSFVREIGYAFGQIAVGREIDFRYEGRQEGVAAWFDKGLFEKVVFNLLSNAFKFTQAGGRVTLALEQVRLAEVDPGRRGDLPPLDEEAQLVHLSVSDTGRGIPEGELEQIFAPFYQVEGRQEKGVPGTGIGLSLTQSVVHLHHGSIWAENNADGGATFHVLLPIGREVYADSEIDHDAAGRVVMDVIPSKAPAESEATDKRYTVLLAEDNEEVRSYVRECLEAHYRVVEADNGETAFDLAVERYPDLVVSDIMMPRRDGLQLCRMLKEDLRTGHIPVILMTARSMVVQIKEGFSSGADDYIVKPFHMDVLICRIRNLLASRERLRSLYGKKFAPESLGVEIVSGTDRFTQKLFEVMERNIANPELNIDLICREVGLSRTNLYRKLKAITELSPTELIRNKRAEMAAKLLLESDYSVSEISTLVGFNSHTYFNHCFKAVYGCSPTEFVRERKKEKAGG